MSGKRDQVPFDRPSLPPGWCWATVAELGEVHLGRQRSPKNRSEYHPTKYIRAANLTWDGLSLSDVLDMEFKPNELDTYRLLPGDVLLSEASGSAGEVGKPVIWRGEIEKCCFQNTVIRFRPSGMPPQFPFVVFSHFARNGIFSRVAKGVGIHHLSADRFARLSMPLAPLNEQRRIVQKIEELFSKLDAGVAALERVKANLKRYRAAVLKAAVEGKLTAEWRKQHPDVEPASKLLERILQERRRKWEESQLAKFAAAGNEPPKGWREKYPDPAATIADDRPGLPKGWTWATVEQLNLADRPISYGVLQPGNDLPEGVPLVRVCDIDNGKVTIDQLKRIAPAISEQFQRTLLQGGEVLLTVVGTIGRTAVAPPTIRGANTARAVAVIAVVPPADPHFVEITFRESSMRARLTKAAHEVARKTLNLEDVRIACLPLAPLPEQEQIMAEVERRLSIVDELEGQVTINLKRAGRLRQSILKRAFAGRLVPQDPADEPADRLLERIRQQRTANQSRGD